jgi:hypothetical protein
MFMSMKCMLGLNWCATAATKAMSTKSRHLRIATALAYGAFGSVKKLYQIVKKKKCTRVQKVVGHQRSICECIATAKVAIHHLLCLERDTQHKIIRCNECRHM